MQRKVVTLLLPREVTQERLLRKIAENEKVSVSSEAPGKRNRCGSGVGAPTAARSIPSFCSQVRE